MRVVALTTQPPLSKPNQWFWGVRVKVSIPSPGYWVSRRWHFLPRQFGFNPATFIPESFRKPEPANLPQDTLMEKIFFLAQIAEAEWAR